MSSIVCFQSSFSSFQTFSIFVESVNVPDFTLDEFKEIIELLLNFSNISDLDGNNDFDYSNNNSVDCEMDSPEHLISSLTRLTSRLQDNNLPEDDIVVVLLELAELEVTIPALLETGTGVVVRRLEKKSQGMVAKLTRELVIKWKGIALKYEPDEEEDDNNKNNPPFYDIKAQRVSSTVFSTAVQTSYTTSPYFCQNSNYNFFQDPNHNTITI